MRSVLTIDNVEAAAVRLADVVTRTPIVNHRRIDAVAGATVHLKAENLQETGAFKYRGASNAIARLDPKTRRAGVVTYSSGNHGQAVAAAAKAAGTTAVVVMPNDAPLQKVALTQSHGARIVRYDRYTESRSDIADAIAVYEGRTVIPPFDHYDVMAGQGTVALELLDQVPDLDALLVPVGGGGLLAGCATVMRARRPSMELYGVEPEAGDDHRQSRRAGRRIDIGVPRTIADGQQVPTPGELTWPINDRLTTQFLVASDAEIVAAMRLLFEQTQMVVEPSGACALAALLAGRVSLRGKRVGVILSGGNVSWPRFQELTSA
ncbi:MAG: pyridoxal-phosphate dependent enzyme [Actinomycetota bacterium]